MRQPAPHEQCIEPHALVLAGPRWHVRAFSITRNEYRDFALGRIVGCELTETPASHRSEADVAWTTSVKVRLIAHPQLSAAQEDMVRHEYFDGAVERVEVMRGALIPYLLHELRVAYEPTKQRPPDYFLAVRNVKDVARWVFPT
jgi:predicted DNA-binding transcriptional regulator YafY